MPHRKLVAVSLITDDKLVVKKIYQIHHVSNLTDTFTIFLEVHISQFYQCRASTSTQTQHPLPAAPISKHRSGKVLCQQHTEMSHLIVLRTNIWNISSKNFLVKRIPQGPWFQGIGPPSFCRIFVCLNVSHLREQRFSVYALLKITTGN